MTGKPGRTHKKSANVSTSQSTIPISAPAKTAPWQSDLCSVIGFLCPELTYSMVQEYWAGINDVASTWGANVVCLAGTGENLTNKHLDLRGVLFDLITPHTFDGLIIWGNALFPAHSSEDTKAFCNRYRPLPMISIGHTPIDDIPEILVSNYEGMYDAVEHLITSHGYQKIVFIRGPEGHPEAMERYRAYADALSTHGLEIDPKLILPGGFIPSLGVKAAKILLDERGLRPQTDFDAIVAANDELILSVSRILQERGIQVPEEVALVGFDNTPETQFVLPPLTTVRQPLYENGKLAAEMLFALLGGEEVPLQTTTPTKLVIRQSCGCISPTVAAAGTVAVRRVNQPLTGAIGSQREAILSELTQVRGLSLSASKERAAELLDNLVEDLSLDPSGKVSPAKTFLPVLQNALNWAITIGENVTAWQEMISVLSFSLSPYLNDAQLLQAVSLWQQARVMIGEIALQNHLNITLQAKNQAATRRDVSHSLRTSFSVNELVEVLLKSLPQLEIASCYLALYENPDKPTEWARLILACVDHKPISLQPGKQRFPAKQLLPDTIVLPKQPYELAVIPLTFKYQQLGFVLFEAKPHEGALYEVMAEELSTALHGAFLMQQEAARVEQLAAVNADLKAAQAELLRQERLATLGQLNAVVSHEIRNPLATIRASAHSVDKKTRDKGLGVERALDRIQRNITRCDEIIGELLDFTRLHDLNPQRMRFDDWLKSVVDEQTIPPQITLALALNADVPVSFDPSRLQRVIINLIDNACQAMLEYGQASDDNPPLMLGIYTETEANRLKITITDTGPGIPPDILPHVFEPLYSTKSFGLGLGLSIVNSIVNQHAGQIEITNKRGTQVTIWLPLG